MITRVAAAAQTAFRRAASQTRDGEPQAATLTLLRWCMGEDPGSQPGDSAAVCRAAVLIQAGAELCATALRVGAGDPDPHQPPDDGRMYVIRLTTQGGRELSFDDIADDPRDATALRCVSATLNNDVGLLASVLVAHLRAHGPESLPKIAADLIGHYLAFSDGWCGHTCGN